MVRNPNIFKYLQVWRRPQTRVGDVYRFPARDQGLGQGGITCGTIDEPRKSSKAIDERVIIDFRDKNVIIARFSDKNGGFLFYR